MQRQRQRRNRSNRNGGLTLPITVRQAQKLLNKSDWKKSSIPEFLYVGVFGYPNKDCSYISDFGEKYVAELKKHITKLASKNPNQVLIDVSGKSALETENPNDTQPDYAPKGTDEVADQSESPSDDSTVHGGDNASQEVEDGQASGGDNDSLDNSAQLQDAGTDEGSQGQGSGDAQDGGSHSNRSDRNAPQSNSSETGNATSEDCESGGKSQAPTREQAESSESPNSELGEGGATPPMSDTRGNTDAAVQNDSAPPNEQVNQDSHNPENSHASVSAKTEDDFNGDRQAENSGDEQESTEGRPQKGEDSPESSLGESDEGCQSANSSEKASDDIPAHQKKWGKSFSKTEKGKLSQSNNNNTGEATASLKSAGVSPKLLKLCRQRLAALVGDSSQQHSPRREYQEFCVRLKTYRNPQPARKEEEGRPVILLLADISGSCASFSEESVKVAKAASSLGVQGADILVISHYNGQPYEMEVNGEAIAVDSIKPSKVKNLADNGECWANSSGWYESLLQRYNITVVIALGDWDGSLEYAYLAQHPQIEKLIWLDNAHCSSRGTVEDKTKWALDHYRAYYTGVKIPLLRQKLIYKNGCKDAIAFINHIKA